MDGVLEQILSELKEIKQLLQASQGGIAYSTKSEYVYDTMKTKEAAGYLGVTEQRLRILSKQGAIKHIKIGNRFLYKRSALDLWLEETQNASVQKNIDDEGYGRIRKVKI